MRVFIGIKCSEELQKKFSIWQKKNNKLTVRFIKSENLHLTLVPPWYIKNEKEIIDKLKKFNWRGKSFEISFNEILYFPPSNPRMIWAKGKTPAGLSLLQKNLLRHFRNPPSLKLREDKEKRAFKLHMTLARFKEGEELSEIKNKNIEWAMLIDKIILFESELNPHGAIYSVIAQKSLNF